MNILCAWLLIPSGMTPQDETRSEEVVSAEGINSQDGTAEALRYSRVLFEVVCAEGINSAGDTGVGPDALLLTSN